MNEKTQNDDIIELGVASVETQGPRKTGEENGGPIVTGISED